MRDEDLKWVGDKQPVLPPGNGSGECCPEHKGHTVKPARSGTGFTIEDYAKERIAALTAEYEGKLTTAERERDDYKAALDKAIETLIDQGFCAQGKLGPKVLPKSILMKKCPACLREWLRQAKPEVEPFEVQPWNEAACRWAYDLVPTNPGYEVYCRRTGDRCWATNAAPDSPRTLRKGLAEMCGGYLKAPCNADKEAAHDA